MLSSRLVAIAILAAVVGLSVAKANAESNELGAWETLGAAEAPTAPYAGQAYDLRRRVEARADGSLPCVSVPHAVYDCTARDAESVVTGQRMRADATLDGPSNAVPPLLESTPDGACVPVEGKALTCTRGGSGGDSGGRTYYKGNRQYECELQRPDVYSTNHHLPKVTYNSMRFCDGMTGRIQSRTRDERIDWETWDSVNGPPDTLVWRSFSARYRTNYCVNDSSSSRQVRCAYDWVR